MQEAFVPRSSTARCPNDGQAAFHYHFYFFLYCLRCSKTASKSMNFTSELFEACCLRAGVRRTPPVVPSKRMQQPFFLAPPPRAYCCFRAAAPSDSSWKSERFRKVLVITLITMTMEEACSGCLSWAVWWCHAPTSSLIYGCHIEWWGAHPYKVWGGGKHPPLVWA